MNPYNIPGIGNADEIFSRKPKRRIKTVSDNPKKAQTAKAKAGNPIKSARIQRRNGY